MADILVDGPDRRPPWERPGQLLMPRELHHRRWAHTRSAPTARNGLFPGELHDSERGVAWLRGGNSPPRNGSVECYFTKLRGKMHAMWNAGSVPARMIEVISRPASSASFASSPT